jgi:D-alanine-D-alanine ligase
MKKTIAIAMGGYSTEAQISLKSGNVVYHHLPKDKYTVYRAHLMKDAWFIVDDNNEKYSIDRSDFTSNIKGDKIKFDVVFNTIHGTPGEDGLLQAYLNMLGIPQTTCDYYQSALTFNKRDCISVLKPYGIPTAKNYFINKGDEIKVGEIIAKVGLPCFVKANKAGSSFGITKVKSENDMLSAIEHSFQEDDEVLIESFLDGIEVSVGVINYQNEVLALPVTQIISENEFFDYDAKYLGKSQEITPAPLPEHQIKEVQDLAIKVFKVMKLKDFTRSEFIFHNNKAHFLEVNTCPGLTEASLLPQQARAANIKLSDLFNEAILEALKKNK